MNRHLGVVGGGLVLLGVVGLVVGLSLIPDISNIARVSIGNIVGNNLGPAIGKVDTVFAVGGISVTVLVGGKVGSRVVISDSIAKVIDSRPIISSLLVVRGSMVDRLVSWGVDYRFVGRSMHNRLVGGGMYNRPVSRLVICWGSMVSRGMVISRGMMVSRGVDWLVSRSMSSRGIFLLIVGLVDLGGLSRGLAHNGGMVSSMGLVHRGVDSRGIAVLDGLMARLVGNGDSSKSRDGNKDLKGK